jgi:hypothetical protein
MNDFKQFQNLLSQLTLIRKQNERILELTGEKFNVFNILGLSTDEVRTHSAFLGEILNPRGSHCQKDLYLKEFINYFNIENFNYSTAVLEIEKSIGFISNDYTEGGTIDLLIKDNNNAIIIENKIYAGDQKNQLLRYHNYGEKNFKSVYLFYLTLDKKSPDKSSTGDLDSSKYICISYEDDIKNWLEKCKEKSVNQPIIRETITQYINLIKQLTGQTINITMNDEIVNKIVNDDDNLKTFFELHKSNLMDDIKKKLVLRFKQQMFELSKELQLELKFNENFGFNKETGFEFYLPNSKHGYYLNFLFCGVFSRLVYGIYNNKQPYIDTHKSLIINQRGNGLGWGNWLWLKEFESHLLHWDSNVSPWLAIIDNSLKENIKEKIKMLILNLEGIEY